MLRPEFNQEQHDEEVSRRYEQLARFEAFDKLVDMALDGVISMEQAKTAWESEVVVYAGEDDGA